MRPQSDINLEAAQKLARAGYPSGGNERIGYAARILWEQIAKMGDDRVEIWSKLTVGEIIEIVAYRGERFYAPKSIVYNDESLTIVDIDTPPTSSTIPPEATDG